MAEHETRHRIALIEDNPDNRLLVNAILDGVYEIDEYATGTEALSGFETSRPDLVLLDISLPEMDGTEVLKRIRNHAELSGVPVIVLTAHASEEDRQRFLALGADEHVSKPIIDEGVLFDAIRRCLLQRGRLRDNSSSEATGCSVRN